MVKVLNLEINAFTRVKYYKMIKKLTKEEEAEIEQLMKDIERMRKIIEKIKSRIRKLIYKIEEQ